MNWLYWGAAIFLLAAGVVSGVRFGRTQNKGHLFLAGCFLVAGGIFTYLALTTMSSGG
jgi:hypothetical protein